MSCSPRNVQPANSHSRARRGVAVVRVEHDAPATRFELEEAGDHARQQQRPEPAVDEPKVGDGGVQPEVVRVGVIARRDGILCRPVDLDVADVLAAQAADERPRVRARQLRPQVAAPALQRPVVLPRLGQVRAVHPLGDQRRVGGPGDTYGIRRVEWRSRGPRNSADLVGHVGQFTGEPVPSIVHRGQSLPEQDHLLMSPVRHEGEMKAAPAPFGPGRIP